LNKYIEITVAATGETRVETKGFAGGECRQASEFVEKALGARVIEELTPEFHQSAINHQINRQSE